MSLNKPVRRVPVFNGGFAIDLVDEARALQMRRHSRYIHLKRKKKRIVAVILHAPMLTASDWRQRTSLSSSVKTTKQETLSRDLAYECPSCLCDASHGGLMRGLPTVTEHKTNMLTREWPGILRHEMRPLYKTMKRGI